MRLLVSYVPGESGLHGERRNQNQSLSVEEDGICAFQGRSESSGQQNVRGSAGDEGRPTRQEGRERRLP